MFNEFFSGPDQFHGAPFAPGTAIALGISGSGKTYAAKGLVELLLTSAARICVVDPLGVWWDCGRLQMASRRASRSLPSVAGTPTCRSMRAWAKRHVAWSERMRAWPASSTFRNSGAARLRRQFVAAFAESFYEANSDPLHLVMDEADLWSAKSNAANVRLGRVEEIVPRARVRCFIPWLITQRPAFVHKDVLSQADT
jgi:DNA helicase HerA-like ATPase